MSFFPAIIGGGLIGLAAGLYLLFNGRIMGVSGIAGGLFARQMPQDWSLRIFFILGMLISPWLYGFFAKVPKVEITDNISILIMGGLLVGFGARLGSGCTSGHGVCGLGRFSKRSFFAVLVFMATAMMTVFVERNILS